MIDGKPKYVVTLNRETAFVTMSHPSKSVDVQLLEVSLHGLSFSVSEALHCAPHGQLSIRFSLPGGSRLHFAMINLLSMVMAGPSTYRYDAKFVRTDPQTIDHIIRSCVPAMPENAQETGRVRLR